MVLHFTKETHFDEESMIFAILSLNEDMYEVFCEHLNPLEAIFRSQKINVGSCHVDGGALHNCAALFLQEEGLGLEGFCFD